MDRRFCTADADYADMRSVCQHLNIPYYSWDFSAEYFETVVEYFFAEYRAGRTPNPDVMCNSEVKFGLFRGRAMKLGADFIATGHYARTIRGRYGCLMKKGVDPIKDQTYFLNQLSQEQLDKTLFPIGRYTKPQIRQLALRFRLPTATKKDSQGICFIGQVDVQGFLQSVIPPAVGDIVTLAGEKLGEHNGAWFYTVGQRRIEGLSGTVEPMYVISTDIDRNVVVVGPDSTTYAQSAVLDDLHWISPDYVPRGERLPVSDPSDERRLHLSAKSRYTPQVSSGSLSRNRVGEWQFTFDVPERAITPGQSLVIYDGDVCLGGGVINRAESRI